MVFEKLRRNKSDPVRPTAKSQRRLTGGALKPADMQRRNTAAMTVLTDDGDEVFYRGPTEQSQSRSYTSERVDPYQYRVATNMAHSPPSSSTSSNPINANDAYSVDACDARTIRTELNDLKDDIAAVRKELLTELQTTRYDMLKEMALIKGALLQLTGKLVAPSASETTTSPRPTTTLASIAETSISSSTSGPLPLHDAQAIARRLTTTSSRATKERLTAHYDTQVPPALRLSTRPTQLMPVQDNSLSTPLQQKQIDELFPLIDCAADISVQARILELGTREWVVDRVQNWLDGRLDVGRDTVLALVGDAGVGKSVAASAICSKFADFVVATHVCKFDHKRKSSPRNVLLSLVNQLTTSLPGFKAQLARLNLRYVLEEKDVAVLARKVLIDPLNGLEEPVDAKCIVVDGLDQCRVRTKGSNSNELNSNASKNESNDLLDFLAIVIRECPTWLGFIVTSKPSPALAASLPITSVLDFSPRNPQYMQDATSLINDALNGMPTNDVNNARTVLKAKSAGNFSYLEFARHALSQSSLENSRGLVPVDILEDLPESLYEIYEEIFEDKFGEGRSRLWRKVQPVLNLVVSAASGPYPCVGERQIADWLSYSKDDLLLVRRSFADIVSVRQGVYYIMSSALFDWLSDPDRRSETFFVDVNVGVEQLRQVTRGEMAKQSEAPTPPRSTSVASNASARNRAARNSQSSSSEESSMRSEDESFSSPNQRRYESVHKSMQPSGILKNRVPV